MVNEAMNSLASSLSTQSDVDTAYEDWCGVLRKHMYNDLPYRTVLIGARNKKRTVVKPWWNDEFTDLWNKVCSDERKWIDCKNISEMSKLKSEYVSSRKTFDRQVQRAKRLYWFDFQKNLLNDCNNDNVEFWKAIGKVGVGQAQKRRIPMEVILEDGMVARDAASVLEILKRHFSSLLNCQEANTAFPHVIREQPAADPIFNEHISIFEVKKALDRSKKGKASGIDQIPVEVLCNDTSISFLHVLFNVCFDKGIIPSMWNKCIISPIPKSSTTDPRDPLSYRGIALASSMYKLYCSVLNTRISSWFEENYKITDEQNGFGKKGAP